MYISQNRLEVEEKKIFLTRTKRLVSQNQTVFYGGAKEEILKEQDKNLLSDGFILNKLDIVSDERGNLIGFLEK